MFNGSLCPAPATSPRWSGLTTSRGSCWMRNKESDMRSTYIVWLVIALMSALPPASAAQSADGARFAQSAQYPLLPRALEIELALSAAAKHLRDDATVWVLDQSGYAIAKKGGNAFTCVVSRRAGDLFPVCWDAEGTRSLLPLDFEDARLRLAGKSGGEI